MILSKIGNSFVERLNAFLGLSPKFDKLLLSQYASFNVGFLDIYPRYTKAVSSASSGDETVISAVAGSRFIVETVMLMAEGVVDVTFKSGSNSLSGAIALDASIGFVAGNIWCNVGEAFIVNRSGAVRIEGYVTYRVVDW